MKQEDAASTGAYRIYGREEIRDWLLENASERLESHSRKRKNYHGPEVLEHGEAKARKLIEEGLRRGLRRGELPRLAKGDAKARIAAEVGGCDNGAAAVAGERTAYGNGGEHRPRVQAA